MKNHGQYSICKTNIRRLNFGDKKADQLVTSIHKEQHGGELLGFLLP